MDELGASQLGALVSPGKLCPFRHDRGDKMVVCKHWLRGLCKKGDQCKFLHQYDATRMPECYFFSKFGNAPSWLWPLTPGVAVGAVRWEEGLGGAPRGGLAGPRGQTRPV